jgi:hypothetical protein
MEAKYGTNILVATLGRQAQQHTYTYNLTFLDLFHFLSNLNDGKSYGNVNLSSKLFF